MSFFEQIRAGDSPSIDAFGRWRTSEPFTLFDSKQLNDNQALFWDDAEVSGSGTASVHSGDEAATTISVGATTAGKRVRQTFQRFNYQPGKSQEILVTFSEFDTATGLTKAAGYFDDDNGLFFQSDEGTVSVVRRSSVTGSAVDDTVVQSSWNIDPMDGTGTSGITLDFTKSQIGFIDLEWLGVGRVRMGFVVNGAIIYCHQFLNTNNLAVVYMSTPNLPLRYEIENDGTGAADDFVHICSSVLSEGGQQSTGQLRYASTEDSDIQANTSGTIYVIVGIRLKTTYLDASVEVERISMINETGDDYEWLILLNPTIATGITFSDQSNSAVQTGPGNAGGPSSSTATGGTILDGGYVKSGGSTGSITQEGKNAIKLGSAIDGTRDEIYLCCRPLSNGADIYGSITWREFS